jgi:hypothetical protein
MTNLALYEAFQLVFWPVMAWATISAWVQQREDLWRAVWLNMAGQFAGYGIIWINATYSVAIDKPYYYMVQFAVFSIVMTKVRAGIFGAVCTGACLAGLIVALVFKLSQSHNYDLLFYYMLSVSTILLLIIAGAASGNIGSLVARSCWRFCCGVDSASLDRDAAR